MAIHRILTAAIALLTFFGLGGSVMAEPPSKAGGPQFAVTSPFMDIDDGFDLAGCADEDEDDQCDNSIAFITKTGHWGIRISGVTAEGAEPFRVCMTYLDTGTGDFGALLLAENLHPIGPNNVLSGGGDVYADTLGLDVVYLPGFAVMRYDETNPTGCYGHLVEFISGARVY